MNYPFLPIRTVNPVAHLSQRVPRYLCFALFNAAYSGILGLVIPRLSRTALLTGIVWAMFYLATTLASLIWGYLVVRTGKRAATVLGLALGIAGMAGLAVARGPSLLLAATLLGIGGAAVQLTSALYVRAWFPQTEWDIQIGALQTWMGAGQVGGLLLVSVVGGASRGALAGAAILIGACVFALLLHAPPDTTPIHQKTRQHLTVHLLEFGSPAHVFHLAHLRLADVRGALVGPLPALLMRWGLLMLVSIPVLNLVPLLLRQDFGLSPRAISVGLAAVAAVAVGEYAPVSRASARTGASDVLRAGILLRAVGVLTLALGAWQHGPGVAALVSYGLIAAAWPPLSVASVIRVSDLATADQVEGALGMYNAVAGGARVIGSLAGGTLASRLGYGGLLGGCGAILLLLLVMPTLHTRSPPTRPD